MKKIKVSDADYETLMSLSKELQLQPSHGQAFPRYWEPRSDRREYDLNGEGEFKILVDEGGEECDPVLEAEDDPKLFGEFLADEDLAVHYREYDGELESFMRDWRDEWLTWLTNCRGYTVRTYDMKPKRDHNPSLFLDDVKEYIDCNQHHLGSNAHTYANTIHRMSRMEKLVEALYRLNPQPRD